MDKVLHRLQIKPIFADRCFIAETSTLIGEVSLGDDSSVWFNAVIRGDVDSISIGRRSNIQDGAILHVTGGYPVVVGDLVTVGHGAILHGCRIGDNVLIGIGSIILDGAVIGSNSIIAAGTLIAPGKVFPENSFVMGHPGKVIRRSTIEEVEAIKENANNYVKYKDLHLSLNSIG